MFFGQYRILAYILIPLLLCGGSFFYGYKTASNVCRSEAEKALVGAIERAKEEGKQDKQLAESASRDVSERRRELDEAVTVAKQALAAAPNAACIVSDDELQYLNSF